MNAQRFAKPGCLALLTLAVAACAPQGIGPFSTPHTVQLSENDRVTPATRAQIEALNAQLEQMAGQIGQRKYMALPLP